PPINIRVCHCRVCQKVTGGPFYARVLVPADRLSITGPVHWFASSHEVRRGFCSNCGSSLFSERASTGAIGVAMGTLDEPERYQPAEHIWVSRKQPWIVLHDGLPQHAEGYEMSRAVDT